MPRLKLTDLPPHYQNQVGEQLHGARRANTPAPYKPFPTYAEATFPGLPAPLTEYKFHPTRKWRFDYYWPKEKVALEVEGAVWVQGRHTRGSGFIKDMEKYNEAAAMGIRVLRCTPQQLKKGEILPVLKRALGLATEL